MSNTGEYGCHVVLFIIRVFMEMQRNIEPAAKARGAGSSLHYIGFNAQETLSEALQRRHLYVSL